MSAIFHTTHGDLEISLIDIYKTPKSAKNFLALCASNYYNDCMVHRSIKGFILQTGDPSNSGNGGESIFGKFFEDELDDSLRHKKRGIVSWASNGPNSNGSQFFITYSKQKVLDKKYTVFGRVTAGLEVLDKIENEPVTEDDTPLNEVRILDVTVTSNPIADMES